ncbi:MAG: helix-turn-helix domain-containing protein, partial [Oscillospiraceae bacterium]|nr:helix-turn-helix domain-containing protein [Oscillospiraceae bacterium]
MREVLIGEYIRSHRKKQGITIEDLCAGICDRSTLSRLERGKQTPSRDKLYALLHRLGLPEDRVFVLVSEHDREIKALKQDIQTSVIAFEKADPETRPQLRERTMEKLKRLEEITDKDDAINRQYILSTQVTLGTPDGPYTPAQRRRLLEKAIRMTVPGFQLDRAEKFRYRLEEMTLLNKLARTFSMEGKREEAIGLYDRLLQNIEDNGRELEGYPGQFCLIAHNYAINLGLAGKYEKALKIAEQGQG